MHWTEKQNKPIVDKTKGRIRENLQTTQGTKTEKLHFVSVKTGKPNQKLARFTNLKIRMSPSLRKLVELWLQLAVYNG